MKHIRIISIKELEAFIDWKIKKDLDSKKIKLLNKMSVRSIYSLSKVRGKTYFTPVISERIIEFAKKEGYEFS